MNSSLSFSDTPTSGMHDYAVLAGARSPGDRLLITGAAGMAYATPDNVSNADGTLNSTSHFAPAFDLSAHAAYRVAGLGVSVSGVLGPSSIRYIAVSVGAELGWFGF